MATHLEMLQALATLDRAIHVVSRSDADMVDLYLNLVGARLDMRNLSDKAIENIGVMYLRYFEG